MYDLARGLGARGVDCDMMCAESAGRGAVRRPGPGARILSYRTWARVASTTIAPSMVGALRRVAADYDLIHVHHPDPMAALALRLSGYRGPVVLHWHADIIKGRAVTGLYGPLQRWLLRRADAIVTTTPVTIERSAALAPHRGKAVCVPIGIDPLEADAAGGGRVRSLYGVAPASGGGRLVFSLGRLVPYKGYRHLVDAAALLPEGYTVVVGGEGPLRGELLRRRDSLGLRGRVHFPGRIPASELPAHYSGCDIFCLPSVMKTEAFGIVQVEAMSLGRPVVATTIEGSGTSWVNSPGLSGLNVAPADPVALAGALERIGSDAALAAELGRGASERYRTLFTLEGMVDSCLELYRSLLPPAAAAGPARD